MRWVGRFIGELWRVSRSSWAEVHPDLRPGSRASALVLFFFLLFFCLGLLLYGIGLERVDRWLESQGSLLDLIGRTLFRLFWALILGLCAFTVIGGLWQRTLAPPEERNSEDRIGFGMIFAAALIGYFAWFGVVG